MLPVEPHQRSQGQHLPALMSRGSRTLADLFPGLFEELAAAGANSTRHRPFGTHAGVPRKTRLRRAGRAEIRSESELLESARCPGPTPHRALSYARPQYAHAMPETSYAKCGDLSLAYQVFGDGPVELVFAGSFASHIELYWTVPEFVAFFERLSTFCRVLLFDKAGVGLSDPVPKVRTLDDRAAEIEAVMDAVGFERAVLFGGSEGGPASIFFAATRPERTRALILTGTFAYAFVDGWDDLDRDPAELRTRLVPSWVRTTRPRCSSSPAGRLGAAPLSRRGAAARQPRLCCRRCGRSASSQWWSA